MATATMKFGLSQMLKATPTIIGRIKRALNFFSGGIVLYLPQIAIILHTTTDDLAWKIGLFILFFNTFLLMFGVDTTGSPATMQTSDATEVKTGNTQ